MVIIKPTQRFVNRWRQCHNCCTSQPKNKQMNSYRECASSFLNRLQCNFEILNMIRRRPFFACAIIGLVLFVNSSRFVTGVKSKAVIRSIAGHESDPHRLHVNWLEYQRQTIPVPRAQPVNYNVPDFSNLFSQLLFIQSRQRNASELAAHVFFKYFNA